MGNSPPFAPFCNTLRGFGTERAKLGTFRGFDTERARLGAFRGLGTERARLGAFRGLGTECARLGPFRGLGTKSQIIVIFLLKKSIHPPKIQSFVRKKLFFFTLKHLPASQKTEIVHEKND